jgi:hypothetical protein
MPGNYTLNIKLADDQLATYWRVADQTAIERVIRRADSLLSMPWSLIAALSIGLLSLIVLLLVYLLSGQLAGARLVFSANGEVIDLTGSLNRRRYEVKPSQLERDAPMSKVERQIECIKLQTIKPTVDAQIDGVQPRVAVRGQLWRSDGEPEYFDNINEGDEIPFTGATLTKEATWLSQSWLHVLLIVLAFLIWFAIFGYLYFLTAA